MTLMLSMESIEDYPRTDISTIEECTEPSNKSTITFSESEYVSSRKPSIHIEIPENHLQHQLPTRNTLLIRLTLVSRIMSFLVVISLILMIVANELTFDRIDHQNTKSSWSLKLVITIITAILLILILYYHYLYMNYYAYRNQLTNWRVELTCEKIFFITLELFICIIHPVPRSLPSIDPPKASFPTKSMTYVSIDVALSLPMFLRLFILARSFMIYSPLIRNISLQSLGYFNHVTFNAYFLIKTCIEKWPTRTLLTISTIVFLIGSWSLRASVYTNTGEHLRIGDAMWLFIVTATTVGYGDIYPTTNFGRSIATIIGLLGLFLSALLIGIITQKIQFTPDEKYVHTFISCTRLAKQHRYQAANVIKFAIKSWYLKRKDKSSTIHYFHVQQKLFHSIKSFQKIRQQQRTLQDNDIDSTKMIITQSNNDEQREDITKEIMIIKMEMRNIKTELNTVNYNLQMLQDTLNILLDNIQK